MREWKDGGWGKGFRRRERNDTRKFLTQSPLSPTEAPVNAKRAHIRKFF